MRADDSDHVLAASPRAGDLIEVLSLLWPAPSTIGLTSKPIRVARRTPTRELLVIPSASSPRMLLPSNGTWAAGSLRRARRNVSLRDELQTRAFSGFLRLGGSILMRDRVSIGGSGPHAPESIESYLSATFGRPITVAVFLGPLRANRKPILQLLDGDGHVIGIAKVGVNPLTRELVASEAEVLASFATAMPPHVLAPKLLHHGSWHDLEIVVQSYLPIEQQARHIDFGTRIGAMKSVAGCRGTDGATLAGSRYLRVLRERVDSMTRDETTRLTTRVLDHLESSACTPITFGAWHGDWTAWNMATDDAGRAMVWDWERFATGVPVGFDALHFEFVLAATDPARSKEAGRFLVQKADRLLAPFGVSAEVARQVALLYLIDLSLRYRRDGQAETGVAGGRAESWLIPVLREQLMQATTTDKHPGAS